MNNEKVNFGSAEKGRNTIVCGFKQISVFFGKRFMNNKMFSKLTHVCSLKTLQKLLK